MSTRLFKHSYFSNKSSDMSEMKLTNPLVLHIASEVVVLLGLTLYFSSKNRALANHINGLQHRLEEQESQIGALKQTVQQMSMAIGQLSQQLAQLNVQISQTAVPEPKKEDSRSKRPVMHKSAMKRPSESHTKSVKRPQMPLVVPREPRSAPAPVHAPQRPVVVQVLEESDEEPEVHAEPNLSVQQEPMTETNIPSDIENADLDAELDEELEQLGLKKD